VEDPASAWVCWGELEIVATVNWAITSSSCRTKVNGPKLTISSTTLPFDPMDHWRSQVHEDASPGSRAFAVNETVTRSELEEIARPKSGRINEN
jgi:hypothetical protein